MAAPREGRNKAIHLAATYGFADVVKNIVCKYDDDISNVANGKGMTPLHCAADHFEVVQVLLASTNDPSNLCNKRDFLQRAALHRAAEANNRKVVELLMANINDPSVVFSCKPNSWTIDPIISACYEGNLDVIKIMATYVPGGNPNRKFQGNWNGGGTSAIGIACRYGHAMVLRFLMKYEPNPNYVENGNTQFFHAMKYNGPLHPVIRCFVDFYKQQIELFGLSLQSYAGLFYGSYDIWLGLWRMVKYLYYYGHYELLHCLLFPDHANWGKYQYQLQTSNRERRTKKTKCPPYLFFSLFRKGRLSLIHKTLFGDFCTEDPKGKRKRDDEKISGPDAKNPKI